MISNTIDFNLLNLRNRRSNLVKGSPKQPGKVSLKKTSGKNLCFSVLVGFVWNDTNDSTYF